MFPKMLTPFHQILVSTKVSETLTLENILLLWAVAFYQNPC